MSAFPIGGGWGYACDACHLDTITSPPAPDAPTAEDFIKIEPDEIPPGCVCDGCGEMLTVWASLDGDSNAS
jgi:hypothetical protein